jgi:hypothetical protein
MFFVAWNQEYRVDFAVGKQSIAGNFSTIVDSPAPCNSVPEAGGMKVSRSITGSPFSHKNACTAGSDESKYDGDDSLQTGRLFCSIGEVSKNSITSMASQSFNHWRRLRNH